MIRKYKPKIETGREKEWRGRESKRVKEKDRSRERFRVSVIEEELMRGHEPWNS